MFIRDYALNVMIDCADTFYFACDGVAANDFDAVWLWCMGA